MRFFNNRQNNTTNTQVANTRIESGYIAIPTAVNSTVSATVTFQTAFINVPIVVAVYGGDIASVTTTLGAGGINLKQAYADAVSLTTTSFLALAGTRDSTNWPAGGTVFIQWIAMGN